MCVRCKRWKYRDECMFTVGDDTVCKRCLTSKDVVNKTGSCLGCGGRPGYGDNMMGVPGAAFCQTCYESRSS